MPADVQVSGGSWWKDILFAGIGSVLGLVGTKVASKASDRAAQIQANAYREGLHLQRQLYEQDRADFAPYRTAGTAGVARMADLLGQQSPPGVPASVQRRLTGPGETYQPVPIGPGLDPITMKPRPPIYGNNAGTMAALAGPVGFGQRPGAAATRSSLTMPSDMAGQASSPPVSTSMPVPTPTHPVSRIIILEAPTGEQRTLSADDPAAALYIANGARILRTA